MSDDANEALPREGAFEIEAFGECPRCELPVTATLLVLAGTTGQFSEIVACPSCAALMVLVVDVPARTTGDDLSTDLIC
jgi:hypothetical protein